ncbi:hypothetical protein ALC62_12451 [Cyphomyrmex costatus]|uniref:Uncharacterized protein n=1 Tax=Cyphomyrmex costatus TaxID=456900 RepID=A0A151IB32_9HYME|nr:hypothetical protein ALC62_12451 [Cyphomyrmex costatus]
MRSVAKVQLTDFFLTMVFSSQTDRLQYESAGRRASVFVEIKQRFLDSPMVLALRERRRSRSTACPVYTEIFIGRANRNFVSSLVEMTRHDTLRYKLEAGQSGLKVPPETETGIEMEQDCGGSKASLGTSKRPLVTADNSSSKRERS